MTTQIQQPRRPVRRAFNRLVGLPPEATTPESAAVLISKPVMDEDKLRQQFGVQKRESKPKLPGSYRQLLNLDPEDIINLFDVQIGVVSEFAQVDFVVPPPMLEHRVRRLTKIIRCSKEIIDGMSAHIIKIRRGKDDPLLEEKATREKYKRDENARIARSNAKLFLYRTGLRQGYSENIWRWVTKPVYFRDVVDDEMIFESLIDTKWEQTDAVLTGGLHTHNHIELVQYFRRGYLNLDAYKTILKLDRDALRELGETDQVMNDTWDNFRLWENAVILAAVHHGIIKPRRDLAELLGLGSILDEPDPIEADDTEDALAIKTGGACYGGRIKGEGYRYRGGKIVTRALSSFDKPSRRMDGDGGEYRDSGLGSLREMNDDTESYDPRG